MSISDHNPAFDLATGREAAVEDTSVSSPGESARLKSIHEAVRSGSYNVPAAAIADRMIERILFDRHDNRS